MTPSSPAAQAARVVAYRRDFPLFAERELRIQSKATPQSLPAIVPFTLYPYQKHLWERVHAQEERQGFVRRVWLKSRQIGTSTLSQGMTFHRTVLWPNTNSIVVAHDSGTAQKIFEMAQRFYDRLSPDIRPMSRYRTKNSLEFENPNDRDRQQNPGLNSRITISTAKNIHSGAGGTYSCVHLSEAARYINPEEIVSSTLQTVPMRRGTYVLVESTARPEGDWFHQLCEDARAGKSDNLYEFDFIGAQHDPTAYVPLSAAEAKRFKPSKLERELMRHHGLTPEQVKFRRLKLEEFLGDEETYAQEYPYTPEECWITKGMLVWPREHLAALAATCNAPLFYGDVVPGGGLMKGATGPLSVWEPPIDGVTYDIGVDTALGKEGGDWSVAEVLRRDTQTQVAEYRCRVEPSEFVEILYNLANTYNTAHLCVEQTGESGYYVNNTLAQAYGYPNMYMWRIRDRIVPVMSVHTGWEMQSKSKKFIVVLGKDVVYRWVTEKPPHPLVRSSALLGEMGRFVKSDSYYDRYEAAPGADSHDDCVIAWLLALVAGYDESFGLAGRMVSQLPTAEKAVAGDWTQHESVRMRPDEALLARAKSSHWGVQGW